MTAWDPASKSATIALSNGNLTATSSTAVSQSVRSTSSKSSGKVYWEMTATTIGNDFAVGVSNATEALAVSGGLGADANGLGFYAKSPPQNTFINGSTLGAGGSSASVSGAVISFAFDITNKKLWISDAVMRAASTPWNNSATDNPSTGTGGNSTATLNAGPYFAVFNDDLGGCVCTANFGGTAFSQSLPTGFSAWDISIADSAATSDATSGVMHATASINDTAVSSDSITAVLGGGGAFSASVSDTAATSDAVSAVAVFVASVADSAITSDAVVLPASLVSGNFFFGG